MLVGCQPVLLRRSFSTKRVSSGIRGWRVPAADPQSLHQDPYTVIKGIHRAVKVLQRVILNFGMEDPEFARLEQVILISWSQIAHPEFIILEAVLARQR